MLNTFIIEYKLGDDLITTLKDYTDYVIKGFNINVFNNEKLNKTKPYWSEVEVEVDISSNYIIKNKTINDAIISTPLRLEISSSLSKKPSTQEHIYFFNNGSLSVHDLKLSVSMISMKIFKSDDVETTDQDTTFNCAITFMIERNDD